MNIEKIICVGLGLFFLNPVFSQDPHTAKPKTERDEALFGGSTRPGPPYNPKMSFPGKNVDSKNYSEMPLNSLTGKNGFKKHPTIDENKDYAYLLLQREEKVDFEKSTILYFHKGKVTRDTDKIPKIPYCQVRREAQLTCQEPCMPYYDPSSGLFVRSKITKESVARALVPTEIVPDSPLWRLDNTWTEGGEMKFVLHIPIEVTLADGKQSTQEAMVFCHGPAPTKSEFFKQYGVGSLADVLDILRETGFASSGQVLKVSN